MEVVQGHKSARVNLRQGPKPRSLETSGKTAKKRRLLRASRNDQKYLHDFYGRLELGEHTEGSKGSPGRKVHGSSTGRERYVGLTVELKCRLTRSTPLETIGHVSSRQDIYMMD